jgi:hypothetical protein
VKRAPVSLELQARVIALQSSSSEVARMSRCIYTMLCASLARASMCIALSVIEVE